MVRAVSVDLCNHGKPLVAGFCLRCQAEINAARKRSHPGLKSPERIAEIDRSIRTHEREAKPGDVWPEAGRIAEQAERERDQALAVVRLAVNFLEIVRDAKRDCVKDRIALAHDPLWALDRADEILKAAELIGVKPHA